MIGFVVIFVALYIALGLLTVKLFAKFSISVLDNRAFDVDRAEDFAGLIAVLITWPVFMLVMLAVLVKEES